MKLGLRGAAALCGFICAASTTACLATQHFDTKAAGTYCESVNDYVSQDVVQKILEDTEDHIDYLETQLQLIDKVGVQNYLQTQMGMPSSS